MCRPKAALQSPAFRLLPEGGTIVESPTPTLESRSPTASGLATEKPHFAWGTLAWDFIWLVFLVGLAILPPEEIHKQLTLVAIGLVQILEQRILAWTSRRGRYIVVFLKLASPHWCWATAGISTRAII